TVTLVGLINAGLITLNQAIPVIMGTNIGTTITAQLIAFKITKMSLPMIAIGFLIYAVGKRLRKSQWLNIGTTIIGFGLLFMGMSLMSSQVKVLTKAPRIMELMATLGQNIFLSVIIAVCVTVVVQSSSAVSGLIITMASGGLIDLRTAICFILGANIGTTVTVCLAAFGGGGTLSAKRAAISHVLFNVLGNLILLPFIGSFANFIQGTSSDIARQVANSHMFFNIGVTLLLLPFSQYLVVIVRKIIKGKEIKIDSGTKYIDDNTLQTPAIALELAIDETVSMARMVLAMIQSSKIALYDKKKDEIEQIKQTEYVVDDLDNKIEDFLNKIEKNDLSGRQKTQHSFLIHALSDIERIGDHANNLGELAELRINKKIRFSEQAFKELSQIFEDTVESVKLCVDVIREGDETLIKRILEIEREVDHRVIELEQSHVDRLERGECTPSGGPIYTEVLSNLERITDHTHNVAYAKRLGF
ncbi:MAG: Na/Pi cotransporter family protein, partial [Vulcanimicrobiota bacterium]